MRSFWVLMLLGLAPCELCLAEESCPWMNAATAWGLLDGSVTATVQHPDKNKEDVNCGFVRSSSSLEINVKTMVDVSKEFAGFTSLCVRNSAPLKAIGNEAVACIDSNNERIGEQVIGRVRDRAFIIRISTTDHSVSQSVLREKATKAAEQIAGNLF